MIAILIILFTQNLQFFVFTCSKEILFHLFYFCTFHFIFIFRIWYIKRIFTLRNSTYIWASHVFFLSCYKRRFFRKVVARNESCFPIFSTVRAVWTHCDISCTRDTSVTERSIETRKKGRKSNGCKQRIWGRNSVRRVNIPRWELHLWLNCGQMTATQCVSMRGFFRGAKKEIEKRKKKKMKKREYEKRDLLPKSS